MTALPKHSSSWLKVRKGTYGLEHRRLRRWVAFAIGFGAFGLRILNRKEQDSVAF